MGEFSWSLDGTIALNSLNNATDFGEPREQCKSMKVLSAPRLGILRAVKVLAVVLFAIASGSAVPQAKRPVEKRWPNLRLQSVAKELKRKKIVAVVLSGYRLSPWKGSDEGEQVIKDPKEIERWRLAFERSTRRRQHDTDPNLHADDPDFVEFVWYVRDGGRIKVGTTSISVDPGLVFLDYGEPVKKMYLKYRLRDDD
jgi:hypothetical protein